MGALLPGSIKSVKISSANVRTEVNLTKGTAQQYGLADKTSLLPLKGSSSSLPAFRSPTVSPQVCINSIRLRDIKLSTREGASRGSWEAGIGEHDS